MRVRPIPDLESVPGARLLNGTMTNSSFGKAIVGAKLGANPRVFGRTFTNARERSTWADLRRWTMEDQLSGCLRAYRLEV